MESSIKLKENGNQNQSLNQNPLCNGNGTTTTTTTTTTATITTGNGTGTGSGSGNGIQNGVTVSICSSDSFSSMMPPPATQRDHELVSANSIELNAAASLSDDSGVPLTTNSSISSGDSYRIGMCKFEIEMVESDGEVSQFDSLDNCSEGGMSAENFNTLKKGPLAPIDPPPEFQDSPQTTLVRSISKNIVNSLRRWTSSQSSFEHLKDDVTMVSAAVASGAASQELVLLLAKPETRDVGTTHATATATVVVTTQPTATTMLCQHQHPHPHPHSHPHPHQQQERTLKESYAINKHLYSSDSILNSHSDNIYDEPNNIISSSLGNSIDLLDEDDDDDDDVDEGEDEEEEEEAASEQSSCSPSLPSPPPPVSIIKIKQTLCPYYQDHTRYFKAIPTEQDSIASAKAAAAQQRFNSAGLSEIHDYDLYYGARSRQTTTATATATATLQQQHSQQQRQQQQLPQQTDNSSLQRRQLLYSPLGHTSHCHYHSHHSHYHHPAHHHHHQHHGHYQHGQRPNSRNSLNSRLSSSHNSLNVSSANKPDDSIFITQAMSHDALFTREISDFYNVPIDSDIYAFPVDMIEQQQQQQQQQLEKQQQQLEKQQPAYHKAASRRNKRNKRKQRYATGATTETSDDGGDKGGGGGGGGKHGKYRTPVQQSEAEPLHMTLDEVKQFYHTLYSDAGKTSWTAGGNVAIGVGVGAAGVASVAGNNKMLNTSAMGNAKVMAVKSSNETIWSVSTNTTNTTNTTTTTARTRSSIGTNRTTNNASGGAGAGGGGGASSGESSAKYLSKQNKHNIDNDKLNNNNNNNNNISNNGSNYAQQQTPGTQVPTSSDKLLLATTNDHQLLHNNTNNKHVLHTEKKSQFSLNLKQKFCSIFRFRRSNHNRCRANAAAAAAAAAATAAAVSANSTSAAAASASCAASATDATEEANNCLNRSEPNADLRKKFQSRALPPLPKKAYAIDAAETETEDPKKSNAAQEPRALQFTSSIEKVKDYGWYWGPLSSEAAEKVLSNEPDGSFIVRDSSDDHYIFSLSFKLNNCVRHVRIEQDQGTFSFGSYAKFKSQTITEFIEKAVEHSRSGRYLFFLHRRPEHGPMRVQLTNPVSRFKHVQSLQHMCRFVILKAVIRKDLIQTLPLPRRLLDYLNYKHCYSEQVESDSSHSQISGEGSM
ncbi:putative uncharacterized protein DDB_G0277255 isoform X2 [Drosophila innubila]|uniref:putative uncharacterized protein DDB_G0277255 isoform X2 n=1 Tax=Drosophila innubila TaxID=198719 RepID=UPI00148D5B4E|nr:putative uncharacterized protein DDB_G0277255 isoform X2 [Drosophila innubila]